MTDAPWKPKGMSSNYVIFAERAYFSPAVLRMVRRQVAAAMGHRYWQRRERWRRKRTRYGVITDVDHTNSRIVIEDATGVPSDEVDVWTPEHYQ